jgi:all-trans-retinol dehydrogenase (NAD+)
MKPTTSTTALVTGGASGIGKLLALGLARNGTRVIVWDRDPAALASLEEQARRDRLPVTGAVCDISLRDEVYARAAEAGPIDLLVNNAGVVSGKTLLETPDDKIVRTFEVNTLALFWTAKAFLPGMIGRNRGHIVTIASAAGIIGVRGLADYSASKFAAVGFDEALRMELGRTKSRVRTTVVCPFFIDTGMFAGVTTRFPLLLPILKPETVVRRILGAIRRGKRRLVLPWFANTVFLMRLFPVAFMDAVAGFFGINASMDHFVGRVPTPSSQENR